MSRDQRSEGILYGLVRRRMTRFSLSFNNFKILTFGTDNWALLNAQELAITLGLPLYVVFNLVPRFLDATERQFGFMLKGLREVEQVYTSVGEILERDRCIDLLYIVSCRH